MGLPTSSAPSGVIVAALSPRPRLAHRRGRLGARPRSRSRGGSPARGRSGSSSSSRPSTSGSSTRSACSSSSWPVWSPSSATIRQRRPCAAGVYPRAPSVAPGAGPRSTPTTASAPTSRRGSGGAVFCRLEHVVPWAIQGAHWEAGGARRAAERRPTGPRSLLAVRRRARRGPRAAGPPPRRAPDRRRLLLGRPHGDWAKAGGRWR